ncbi:MAG: M23 family metallopeptidase [Hyphomicrobiaceae bacterium]
MYRGRARRSIADIFDADHAEGRQSGRFRWMLSTMLAAGVGAIAIGIVIFGSLEPKEANSAVPSVLSRLRDTSFEPALQRKNEGLRWAVPKTDRLQPAASAPVIRQLIHELIQVRRNGRPYNQIRPYVRISTRLLRVPSNNTDVIPPFNPFALYNNASGSKKSGAARNDFKLQIKDLIGIAITAEDGLQLSAQDVSEIVAQFQAEQTLLERIQNRSGADDPASGGTASAFSRPIADNLPRNTTVIHKTASKVGEVAEDLERHVRRVYTIQKGESLTKVLRKMGGDLVQVRSMLAAMRHILPEKAVVPGLQLHVTLVPSLTHSDLEPARFSLFTEDGSHKVSVMRNAAGEFIASPTPFDSSIARAALSYADKAHSSSIYTALYYSALQQGIPADDIQLNLRVHAYDTDFRRRVSPGDFAEYFFELKDEQGGEGSYGDMLFTSIVTGGEMHRFWRYRTSDGAVDYYDQNGNNSRKFLLRRPVRGESVRLSSGFGLRYHPILRYARPHNGLDWAAPVGTPILAAGNGVIEEARYRGEFGNYVRISHANGYQTAYAHMSRYAPGTRQGVRVRQGEVIGYIGTTGLSAGPHVHYEVLVNSRPVDPLSIQVPRERQLTGKTLADFQKERARIDELMRRPPVTVTRG